ncbi:MAG: hypothetical protein ACO3PR_08710, partial [Limisphaerales bacterium]
MQAHLNRSRKARSGVGFILFMALLLHGHQATAASLMEPGLRLSAVETSAMQAALIPLNEAIHALQEPDHAWAKPHMPDVLVFQKAVSEALEHN